MSQKINSNNRTSLTYFAALACIFTGLALPAFGAKKVANEKDTQEVQTAPTEKANIAAPKGGLVNYNIQGEPPTIHPLISSDFYSRKVKNLVLDSMMERDIASYKYKPKVAERFEISKDKKTFTFFLRKDVKFHDGSALTAEDVKFSFDAIFEPKYEAANLRPYYENIEKAEVVDPYTIKFTAKDDYFQNFDVVAEMSIIPKSVYADVEKSKKMNKTLIGCGPYKFDKWDVGQKIVLKRDLDWYGFKSPGLAGEYNTDTINLRFVKDENVMIEMVKKGDLDFLDLSSEQYMKKTEGEPWGKTVFKNKVQNSYPKGYGFIGWNQKRDLFKDKNVRMALYHLINREEMNQKFRFGLSTLASGPAEIFNEAASPDVKPVAFDPKKAGELLTKAGWKDTDKDGTLDKVIGGKKTDFKFTLLYVSKDREKYWTFIKEDYKKAGIDMDLKLLEWNSFNKVLDEKEFDAVTMGWSGQVEWDPKQLWHTSSATNGGSNYISYSNTKVDKLIDEARKEMDRAKRVAKHRKVYEMIAADAPYAFLFNEGYQFYANTSRMQKPADTFKYDVGRSFWWVVQ